MNASDARFWHPWLRINRALRRGPCRRYTC